MHLDIDSLPTEARKALEQFPEFEFLRLNDTGANSYIMIGNHSVLQKEVAIKIYFHDQSEVDQEPTIISSLDHPNILKVYDARRVENNCSFYLMPAAKEGDLREFLNKYEISTHLAYDFLCQLLSGLAALHADPNNLVHRDIKPENLLIDNRKLLIADFGSVRKIDISTGKAPASKHSILCRPPEAFGENAFFDYSSDVYQAGIIAFSLFGGNLENKLCSYLNTREIKQYKKINGNTDYDRSKFVDSCIEKKIGSGNLLNWNSLPFYITKNTKRVLKKAVAPHINRYNNVSEFLSKLTKLQSSLPDWIITENGYELQNWNGNDYIIKEEKGHYLCKKKRCFNSNYRVDNRINASTLNGAFEKLKNCIGLPS